MIGIVSDAHGHAPGFALAIAALESGGADRFIFLGDAVGYLPAPDVVRDVRALGERVLCVRGNHEELLLAGTTDDARDAVYQHRICRERLSADDLAFLAGWPASRTFACQAGSVLCVHGSPGDPVNGYLYSDTPLIEVEFDFVFTGHTHRPFVREQGRTRYVNVGSCGLPRDGGAVGSAALFDEVHGTVRLLHFDLRDATNRWLETLPPVHPSVTAVFAREAPRRD